MDKDGQHAGTKDRYALCPTQTYTQTIFGPTKMDTDDGENINCEISITHSLAD